MITLEKPMNIKGMVNRIIKNLFTCYYLCQSNMAFIHFPLPEQICSRFSFPSQYFFNRFNMYIKNMHTIDTRVTYIKLFRFHQSALHMKIFFFLQKGRPEGHTMTSFPSNLSQLSLHTLKNVFSLPFCSPEICQSKRKSDIYGRIYIANQ